MKFSAFRSTAVFLAAVLSAGFIGCKDDPQAPRFGGETCPRTVVMYIVATNSLRNLLENNIRQTVYAVGRNGLPSEARMIVYLDTYSAGGADSTVLLDVVPAANGTAHVQLLKRYERQNSLDPAVMRTVLADVTTLAPNDSYGIILSSHATGWFPPEAGYIAEPRSSDTPGGPAGHNWNKKEGAAITRSFGDDQKAAMAIPDLSAAMSGVHFDFMLFDACFMSSIEALYDLRRAADYIVASPVEVMGAGFPYAKIIPMLFHKEAALAEVCSAFVDTYRAEPVYKSAAVALIDCSGLDALAESVRRIVRAGTNEVDPDNVQALEGMGEDGYDYGGVNIHAFFDLEDYVSQLCPNPALLAGFQSALKAAVPFEDHTQRIYSAYKGDFFEARYLCGVSCYIPRDEFPVYKALWSRTEWARYVAF